MPQGGHRHRQALRVSAPSLPSLHVCSQRCDQAYHALLPSLHPPLCTYACPCSELVRACAVRARRWRTTSRRWTCGTSSSSSPPPSATCASSHATPAAAPSTSSTMRSVAKHRNGWHAVEARRAPLECAQGSVSTLVCSGLRLGPTLRRAAAALRPAARSKSLLCACC